MDTINLKSTHSENQILKNAKVLAFNLFAGFFNWFVVLICLVILAAGYWWLIKPKYDFIATNQELNFRGQEYEEKLAYLKKLGDVKNLYKSISQADKDKIDLILSSNQDLDRLKIILLREIGKVGKERGAIIDGLAITPFDNSSDKLINIKDSANKAPVFDKLILIQVSFSAKNINYDQLKKMLARLQTSLRIMDVTDLKFDPGASQADIKLVTYYLQS